MAEGHYVVDRHIKKDGWMGKYHLVLVDSKVTLCSIELRYAAQGRFGNTIEQALKSLARRSRPHAARENQACQTCIKRAQKLRNPLDRLADIAGTADPAPAQARRGPQVS